LILPSVQELLAGPARHPAFQSVLAALRKPAPAQLRLTGLTRTAQALYTVLLHKATDRPVVLVVPTNPIADEIAETMGAFFELAEAGKHRRPPLVLPAHDVTPYDGLSPHAEISEKRGIGLWTMAAGEASIVVAPIRSALLKAPATDFLRNLAWTIEIGDEFFLEDLEQGLVSVGYERHEPVEMVGQFSVRGGIVDVFSPEAAHPVRIEMLGDQVESLRFFDAETQKSIQPVDQTVLLPLTEYPVFRISGDDADGPEAESSQIDAAPITPPGREFLSPTAAPRSSALVELLENPIFVWSERDMLASEAEKHWERLTGAHASAGEDRPAPGEFYFSFADLEKATSAAHQVMLEELGMESGEETLHISSRDPLRFQGNIGHLVRELQAQIKSGTRALIAAPSLGEVERLADIFSEFEIPYQLGLKDPARGA
jgi:transcription-repair coupling factor (superfamily II helicase)